MKRRLLAAAILPITLLPSSALADSRDGSAEAHDYMRRYARCAVGAYHREAVNLVTSVIDADNFRQKFPTLVIRDAVLQIPICQPPLIIRTGIKVNFDGEPLPFALAEALVDRDWKNVDFLSLTDVPPLPRIAVEPKAQFDAKLALISSAARRARLQSSYDRSVATAWLSQYGECVVRHDPLTSRAWLLTAQQSREEALVVKALVPAYGVCLSEGEALEFNKDILRGTIAVSYVRLATSAQTHQSRVVR